MEPKKRSLVVWAPLLVAVLLLAGLAVAVSTRSGTPASEPEGDDEEETGWERWVLVEDRQPSSEPRRGAEARPSPPGRWEGPSEAQRERWRERWRRSVEIVPLGPRAPRFGPDEVREALSPGRRALRECVEERGGWRALRAAAREGRPEREPGERRRGERTRRSVSFDVRPDGTVDRGSVRFEPALPEAFDGCMRDYYGTARFEGGSDGAHVELPLGGGRRGRPDASGDAGVYRERSRRR